MDEETGATIDAERISALIAELANEDSKVQEAAVASLIELGEPAYEALITSYPLITKAYEKRINRSCALGCLGWFIAGLAVMVLRAWFRLPRWLDPSSYVFGLGLAYVIKLGFEYFNYHRRIGRILTASDSPKVAGIFISIFDLEKTTKNTSPELDYRAKLLRIFPKIEDAGEAGLTKERLIKLAKSLNEKDIEWTRAVLSLLERVGGAESLDHIQGAIHWDIGTENLLEVRDAATRTWKAIDERLKTNREHSKLLRPSEIPAETGLLRPAAQMDTTPVEQLVRPMDGD